jgi:hypothetical protein
MQFNVNLSPLALPYSRILLVRGGVYYLPEPNISFEFVPIPRPYPSVATYAHPCPPMLFKLRPCIQKLRNVYYPPTPSLGWIGQIKGRSLSLASSRRASWLAYSLHPRSLTLIWSWMQGCRDAGI